MRRTKRSISPEIWDRLQKSLYGVHPFRTETEERAFRSVLEADNPRILHKETYLIVYDSPIPVTNMMLTELYYQKYPERRKHETVKGSGPNRRIYDLAANGLVRHADHSMPCPLTNNKLCVAWVVTDKILEKKAEWLKPVSLEKLLEIAEEKLVERDTQLRELLITLNEQATVIESLRACSR